MIVRNISAVADHTPDEAYPTSVYEQVPLQSSSRLPEAQDVPARLACWEVYRTKRLFRDFFVSGFLSFLTPAEKCHKLACMEISNFTAVRIRRLIFVCLVSMVLGAAFASIISAMFDGTFLPEEHLPYLLLGGFSGFFISLAVVSFDMFYAAARPHPLIVSLAVIPAIQALIILAVYGTIYAILFGPDTFIEDAQPGKTLMFSLLVTFLVRINSDIERLLGKHVFRGLLLGRYTKPKKENRFVMFLDIAGSTTIAERIGDVQFHAFLNDFFCDVSRPIVNHRGEIYKYVGDEVIITWNERQGIRNNNVVMVYESIMRTLVRKTDRYLLRYGFTPEFRCGLHFGPVVMGEMGLTRQEIAFSGDVMNTTARIQGECRPRDVHFLVSRAVLDRLPDLHDEGVVIMDQGSVTLRGKSREIAIASLQR